MEPRNNEGGSFLARIALPSALAVALFIAATFLYIVPSFERNMLDRKRETISELNNTVHALLEKHYAAQKTGASSPAAARRAAAEAVRALRYGPENKDYFWITDLRPRMVAHPYRQDLEGKDLSDFKDSHGKLLFVEFADIARRSGGGYSEYMWQWKDDERRIVPKLSHVRLFEPWGWVYGTGIYIEDVREEMRRLESGLIRISLLIAAVIALILLYVNGQSLRIERSRREAERRLAESEEKHRKLVEAATEGILMVLGGKIAYSNRVVREMLGYGAEELEALSLAGLLDASSSAGADQLKELLEEGGAAHQVEAALRRRDGEKLRALLTASPLVFGGREGFILSVRDIDRHLRTEEELAASREKFRLLTDAINLGVLRAGPEGAAEANPAAVRLLGYRGLEELRAAGAAPLSPLAAAGLFSGEALRESPLTLAQPGGAVKHLLATALPAPEGGGFFDCLLEDVTARRRAEAEREKLLSDLQLSLGSLNQSVRGVARPAVRCQAETAVAKAAELMTRSGASSVFVESGGEVIGVVTDHDLRARVLAGGATPAGPVSRVMSAPLVSVPETALLFEAVLLMQERNIRHLAVRDAAGRVTGVIDQKELLALKWHSPAALMKEFSAAETPEQVFAVKARLPRLVKTLCDSGADSAGVTRLVSSAADAAAARFCEFAVREFGEPPAPYAFLALGSQARGEQTLVTDQDNALVYADPPPGAEAACEDYFRKFAARVCGWLAEAGYPPCKGGAMASNPKWCRPLTVWKGYFNEWAGITDPQALLDINVYFDFRPAAGEPALEAELRAHVRAALKDRKLFFLNLANNALAYKLPVGFRGALQLEDAGPLAGTFDAKQLGRVLTDFARIHALRSGVGPVATLERLAALEAANVIDRSDKESFSQALDTITRLRLRRQAAMAASGSAPDNRIKPSELSQADAQALREAAAACAAAVNSLKDLVKFLIV